MVRNMHVLNFLLVFTISFKLSYFHGTGLNNKNYFVSQLQRTIRQANAAECVLPTITYGNIKILKKKSSKIRNFLSLNISCENNYILQPQDDYLLSCINGFWDVDDVPQCVSCKQRSEIAEIEDDDDPQLVCPESSNENYIFRDCGLRIDKTHQLFVVNGTLSKFAEFPWHVGIYKKDQTDLLPMYHCGGSIITVNSILTVAHCLSDAYGKVVVSREYYVVAGKYHSDYNSDRETSQKRKAARTDLHPRYRGEYVNHAWDIAVVIVDKPFETSTLVHPVCIDWKTEFENEHLSSEIYGEVAGWGKTETSSNKAASELRVLKVPFINGDQCIRLLPNTFIKYITPDKFCAGYSNGSSVCDGDSGGGLVFERREKRKTKYYLRGLVSVGLQAKGGCDNYKYSTYTKVSDYIPFIRESIQNKNNTATQSFEATNNVIFPENVGSSREPSVFCTTPNKEQAKCVSIYDCKIFVTALQNDPTTEVLEFMKKSICGKKDEKKVCCGSTISFFSIIHSNPITSNPIEHRNLNLLPTPGVCGRQTRVRQGRIVGGIAAELLDYPWMALLEFGTIEQSAGFLCAGFLINERYVLTAGHCVIKQRAADAGQVFRIRLGEYDLDTEIDCINPNTRTGVLPNSKQCADPPLNEGIEEIIVHPLYERRTHSNDIALIRLTRNISYTDFIKPICLPRNGEKSLPGKQISIAGWGLTEYGGNPSSIKIKAIVSALSDEDCAKRLEKGRSPFNNISHVCISDSNGKDTCQGDTGGPLMSTLTNSRDIYAEGIVSFGIACGLNPSLTVGTKVASYMNWILDVLKP